MAALAARRTAQEERPHADLEPTQSATEKQIKSHYKRLSVKFHPDKVRPDASKNETVESLNDHYVELTKAYQALTDEEVRNNYIQYGHPDGKQSFSIGIALPQWLVTEGSGKYVLLVYAVLLGVILPYMVGKWWYGTQKLTKEKVLIASAGNIFREYDNEQGETGVIGALSTGEEFNEVFTGHKAENGLSKLEQKVLGEADSVVSQVLTKKDRQKLDDLEDSRRRKVLTLLWAYLGRVELDDEALNDEKFEVAPIAIRLNEAYTSIALAYGSTKAVLSAYRTSQNLIQALRPGASPLEQLPHFTPAIASAAEAEHASTHLSLQEFMKVPEGQRRARLGLLSQEQYSTAMSVASRIPVFTVEKAFFKVVGERYVTPSSLVQFVLKGRFIPSGASDVPEVNPKDLLDIDPEEGDVAAITGRKTDRSDEKPIQPPLAHAPYYARDHAPRYHVFLADSKQGRIAVPPFTFSTFDKPILDASGNPTYNVQTLKMQFGAPPQAGSYTFVMHMICDSYVGMDTKMEVTLVVEDASKAEQVEEEGEISEPDEGTFQNHMHKRFTTNRATDTIAGQMRVLKGGEAPKKKRTADDSSGSDTEGDVESESETDTDTDTDDE